MTRIRIALSAALFATALLAGCRNELSPDKAVEVEVSGKVVGPDGSPLRDVRIGFTPTGGSAAANSFILKDDGTFSGKLRAGKYAYVVIPLTEDDKDKKSAAVLKTLPDHYKVTSLERQVNVSGGSVELKF